MITNQPLFMEVLSMDKFEYILIGNARIGEKKYVDGDTVELTEERANGLFKGSVKRKTAPLPPVPKETKTK